MKRWAILGLVLCLGLLPLQAQATERGFASYPDGAENFFAGALPPPGFYFQNYILGYHAPLIRGAVPPESRLEAVYEVLRFIYISKFQILGASWGAQVVVPFGYVGAKFPAANLSDYQFGVGNISLDPLLLGWHFGDYHVTFGFDIDFPGTYSRDKLASPSQNYFTFRPVLGLAWMPRSGPLAGFGANVKMMYDFPTINYSPIQALRSRDYYKSGQAFHFDYCLDYAVMKDLRLGVAGFYYVQTTEDVQDGAGVGNHARQFAMGPAIKYDYQRWSFLFIPQFEMATLNRTEGQRYWFRVWYAF
jgi:hypothetical protein